MLKIYFFAAKIADLKALGCPQYYLPKLINFFLISKYVVRSATGFCYHANQRRLL